MTQVEDTTSNSPNNQPTNQTTNPTEIDTPSPRHRNQSISVSTTQLEDTPANQQAVLTAGKIDSSRSRYSPTKPTLFRHSYIHSWKCFLHNYLWPVWWRLCGQSSSRWPLFRTHPDPRACWTWAAADPAPIHHRKPSAGWSSPPCLRHSDKKRRKSKKQRRAQQQQQQQERQAQINTVKQESTAAGLKLNTI